VEWLGLNINIKIRRKGSDKMKHIMWKIAFGIVCVIFLVYVPMTLLDIFFTSIGRGWSGLLYTILLSPYYSAKFWIAITIIILLIWFGREAFRE
jgi:hypothetical protein